MARTKAEEGLIPCRINRRSPCCVAFRGETDLAFQWRDWAYTEPDSAAREIKSEPVLSNPLPDPRYTQTSAARRLKHGRTKVWVVREDVRSCRALAHHLPQSLPGMV